MRPRRPSALIHQKTLAKDGERFVFLSFDNQRELCHGFDQLDQAALGSRSSLLMDQVLGGCLVQPFLCQLEFFVRLFLVTRSDCVPDFAKLGAESAFFGTVRQSELRVLTETFFGA